MSDISNTSCGFKIIKRPDLIIPNKNYLGNLPIEVIVNDLYYISYQLDWNSKAGMYFRRILDEVIAKVKNKDHHCKRYYIKSELLEEREQLLYFLVILSSIVTRRYYSCKYFMELKEQLESFLNVRIEYSSVEAPVNNSS